MKGSSLLGRIVFIAILSSFTLPPLSAGGSDGTIIITEKGIAYEPDDIQMKLGETLRIKNADPFFHITLIRKLKEDGSTGKTVLKPVKKEEPGQTKDFIPREPGMYELRCIVHDGMTATLLVVR